MQSSGYNPIRRNRNIGTPKSGHGQDNRLVIPWAWADDRCFYEKLVDPVVCPIQVGQLNLHILIEPPLSGFVHACTVDDICCVLKQVPFEHLKEIKSIVLRQPKKKEQILSPVWGRLIYYASLGKHSGPAIYLEAQEISGVRRWKKSMTPDAADELERLRADGHRIETDKRHHSIYHGLDSTRNTQLYRTLPHEVGHYVDYLESVVYPSNGDHNAWVELNEKYHARSSREKESFAHRYADSFVKACKEQGSMPFPRLSDLESMKNAGIKPEWFGGNE